MTTKEFMGKFRRKLTHYEGKVMSACGHEEAMVECARLRWELETFVEGEHEKLRSVTQEGVMG